jgi:hypothetical protein
MKTKLRQHDLHLLPDDPWETRILVSAIEGGISASAGKDPIEDRGNLGHIHYLVEPSKREKPASSQASSRLARVQSAASKLSSPTDRVRPYGKE